MLYVNSFHTKIKFNVILNYLNKKLIYFSIDIKTF